MTIKHQNKNISAEKQYVITDVQDNPNGILTFTLSNLYSNTTDTLQIDLSKHKLTLTKVTQSELNRLKNSQDEIDIKNRESHIYLVQKNTNDEGVYQEFIWVDNDFEIVGSTAINLEPYFLKENIYNGLDYSQNNNTKALSAYQGYLLNQNKINKSDIVTNLTTDNDNKVLSAKQGKLLQDNKLNKNQTSYKGKNVVVDNNSGEITFEDKPTIPEASTTTPLSDSTNGSTGNSDKWAKADHVHPKSNLYAESGHNHDTTYIKLSNTTGLVKNDGSIDTTSYLSSLPNHTHTKSEITDFTHTHSISDITTLQTTLNGKANKSHTHNEYVTNQELDDNISIDYVITATDSTSTESVSPFIVGEDYYFTIMAVQTSSIGVTVMSIPINDIRCEIVHSGAVADLTPVKSDENTVTFKFTPTEQKGHILKVYFLGIPVATYTFDAVIDTGWQEVTFKSGYSRYSDSTSVYIRRKGDLVELTGVWKPTSKKNASSNPVPFASIPNELKPTKAVNIICLGQGKNTYVLTVDDALLKWSRYGTTTSIDLADGHFGSIHCTWII